MKSASSKDGIKRFWLHHSEKLILSLAIGLTGLFFWLGFNVKPFREKSASDLVDMAGQASSYIGREDSWEQIRTVESRQAELEIVRKIEAGEKAVDTSKYPFGPISIRAKKPGLRKDPVLKPPVDLVAHYLNAPVIVNPGKLKKGAIAKDPLADFPMASMPAAESRPRSGQDSAETSRNRDEAPDWGTTVLAIHEKFLPGIRPRQFGIRVESDQAFLTDVVVVTALVEFKDQKNEYLEKLMDAIGYFPKRDKPVYKYFEVQRSKMENGEFGKWEDISNLITRYQDAAPRMTSLPNAEFPSAPEIVAEECFDPVLTSPIPAMTQFDYRPYVNHPKLANRKFDPIKKEKKAETITDLDVPEGDKDSEEEKNTDEDNLVVRRGSDTSRYRKMLEAKKSKNEYKLVRFFDLSRNKNSGEVYRYRIRLWLSDPNNEGDPSQTSIGRGNGGGRGMSDDMEGGGRGMGMGGMEGGGRGTGMGGGRGMSDDMEGGGREMGGMGGLGGGGRGMGGTEGGGRGGIGGTEGSGRGGIGEGRGGNAPEDDEESRYSYVAITPQMTDPDVRARLVAAKEEKDSKDKDSKEKDSTLTYFVKENGYDELVQIPKGREELRFARPTPWSEPVEIKIPYQPKADLLPGKADIPKGIKLESLEIADAESAIDLVVTYWSDVYNAMLPARKKTFRGELLNLVAKVNVLNPISWQVHSVDNAKVDSDAVVVDMLGGRELELPRDELMKYHRASDVLLMQADGTMKINNELDSRTRFKQALLQKDDSNEVGTPPKPKAPAPDTPPPRGGPGGGRGR